LKTNCNLYALAEELCVFVSPLTNEVWLGVWEVGAPAAQCLATGSREPPLLARRADAGINASHLCLTEIPLALF